MDDSPAGSIILFVLLMICSGYFAGTEISFASVNKIHMMSKASNGDKSAERVLKILDNFDEALSVLLIGNNVAHIGMATISTVLANEQTIVFSFAIELKCLQVSNSISQEPA